MKCLSSVWITSIAALAVGLCAPAYAADVTRIASSFDDNDPFDIDIQIGFQRTQKRSKITQEYHNGTKVADVIALRYYEAINEMPMELHMGLYKDLELKVSTSLIFSDHKQWRLPIYVDIDKDEKFDPETSTVLHNRIDPWGSVLSEDLAIIDLENNNESYRSGLGNISVGLRWAPFSEKRDPFMPMWVLGFEWTIPSASIYKPAKMTTSSDKGDIGDGVHRFTFSTAFSKQFGVFDPYVSGWYSLPLGSSRRYDNCDEAAAMAFGGNCESAHWSEDETSLDPPHVGGFFVGTEIVPWEKKETEQRVSIDIRAGAMFVGSGRTYNELSDALGKLLWTEGYVKVGGSIGLDIQPVKYLFIRLDAGLYHETAHFITGESTGKDLDGLCPDASIEGACIDTQRDSQEVNPSYDFRYDVPGRRFRVSETSVFTFSASLRGQF